MTSPTLVKDSGAAIQAVRPDLNVSSVTSGSSQRVAFPADTSVVRIASTVDLYIAFGNSAVTASSASMLFPVGAEVFSVQPDGITHVAFIQVGATPGVFSATKMV
jgi:hypothetical protein